MRDSVPVTASVTRFGRQVCGSLDEGTSREWLVTDGLGGFAMGTVAGLRTRRYHGLLVVATPDMPGRRHLGLASLDPVLVLGDRRVRLATHEWASGAVDPAGHVHRARFELHDGVPSWQWWVGDVVVEAEVAMAHGQAAVGVVYRLVRAAGPVRLEVEPLCTWRDVHGERSANGPPAVQVVSDGFVFEDAYRVRGSGYQPGGAWYRGVRHREETARGLNDREDLWWAGRFVADLEPGEETGLEAWALPGSSPATARVLVRDARARAARIMTTARPVDAADAALALAADQFVVAGPAVVAGYPWFGEWSRDTMTSYEGLFLDTGRVEEGRALLLRTAGSLSEGMLANTADAGATEYNAVDAALWFLHAVARHVEVTGENDLAAALVPALQDIVARHVSGTRFGIRVDPSDGLVTQGAAGWALTWMDARVDGVPVTARMGKPVEVNALWVSGLAGLARLQDRVGVDASAKRSLEATARQSFLARFPRPDGGGLYDVVDGPDGDDPAVRPNQLLAASLPYGPMRGRRDVVAACAPLLTSLGLRSLAPSDPGYASRHRGGPAERDRAYHAGTVWPWLMGPYVDAALAADRPADGLLDGLVAHLGEWGLGSVSETADGDPPHDATGCPFQAWSVAELLRARRLLRVGA
ncbi:MAG: amylo-alpha-1,6-glucosidase [Actinomycetota bacterium]|nr:amylo-alpha-1,6-glucosidase [Actinomycetota bacterium]